MRAAHGLLTAAAGPAAATDPARAFWMLLDAFYALWLSPLDEDLIAETADRFGDLALSPDDPLIPLVRLVRWDTAMVFGGDAGDFASLGQVVEHVHAVGAAADPLRRVALAAGAMLAGQDSGAARIAAALVADSRARGMIVMLPTGLVMLTIAQTMLGQHRSALISGTEALQVARDTGQPTWIDNACGALAYLAAIEGDEQRCREYADEALLGPAMRAGAAGTTWAQAALALLDLGLGRVQDAFGWLESLAQGPTRHHIPAVRSAPDHIEAAVRRRSWPQGIAPAPGTGCCGPATTTGPRSSSCTAARPTRASATPTTAPCSAFAPPRRCSPRRSRWCRSRMRTPSCTATSTVPPAAKAAARRARR